MNGREGTTHTVSQCNMILDHLKTKGSITQAEADRLGVINMSELKPCPKCGSENVNVTCWGMWTAWCRDCLYRIDGFIWAEEAIKAWNRRNEYADSN